MEWVSGNIFIRPNHMKKAGDKIHGHQHNFDHTSIVLMGSVHIIARAPDGTVIAEREFRAPPSAKGEMDQCHVLIKAGYEHEITALEDDTVFWCVYSHRRPQGEIYQEYTGWDAAYV